MTQHFQRCGMDKTTAEEKARFKGMSTYRRTKSRPTHNKIAAVRRVVEVHTQLDARGGEQGELPLLTPPKQRGKSRPAGTGAVVASFISCLDKGCRSDPLPMEEK